MFPAWANLNSTPPPATQMDVGDSPWGSDADKAHESPKAATAGDFNAWADFSSFSAPADTIDQQPQPSLIEPSTDSSVIPADTASSMESQPDQVGVHQKEESPPPPQETEKVTNTIDPSLVESTTAEGASHSTELTTDAAIDSPPDSNNSS